MSHSRRGGRRPRHPPSELPVSSSGRWGRRRARVHQCAAILGAELVYDKLLREGAPVAPGWCAELEWQPDGSGASWSVKAEVLPNAVWRHGRLFFQCSACRRRATRLFVPVVGDEPRCRRCWGLNYESQSWSYKATGAFAFLGPLAYERTDERRRERRRASRARYDARRTSAGA
jgi:hypothetical protein